MKTYPILPRFPLLTGVLFAACSSSGDRTDDMSAATQPTDGTVVTMPGVSPADGSSSGGSVAPPVNPGPPGAVPNMETTAEPPDTSTGPVATPLPTTSTETPGPVMPVDPMPPATEMPTEPEPAVMMEPDAMMPDPEMMDPEPTMQPEPEGPEAEGPPNPSGLPEPGEGGVPRPAGAPGGLVVLDWAGFKAALTHTFDDCNSSQLNNFDTMLGLGVPFTFYMWTGKNEASDPRWGEALAAGHELGNHTQSHQSSGNLGPDTDAAQAFLMDKFQTVAYTMAAPNGSTSYIEIARPRFLINRGVNDGAISPGGNNDQFNLNGYIPPTGAGAQQFNSKVDAARANGTWQITTIHGFTGGSDGAYQPISLEGWVESVEYAKSFGDVWIGTMRDIGAYWQGQKAFLAGNEETSGDQTTWTWTLPDNFPPGAYLRVTVEGGTLTQDGSALPWNEHGFYEVALDSGSLTLSP